MAHIKHPQLAITTDRPHNKATITVTCEVEFTDFEVNAMNMLGVRYSLQCHLLDMEMLYPDAVVAFDRQVFPRLPGGGNTHEHALFVTDAAMSDLHWYVFGKDTLVAELTLKNEETGIATVKRSDVLQADLTA